MRRVYLYGILLLFNSCGVLLVSAAIQQYVTAGAAVDWPTVQGRILSVQVDEVETEAHQRERGEPIRFTYHARVAYEYSVGEETYQGSRITVNDYGTEDRQRAVQIAMQFQQGGPVAVYFDPHAPQTSLLKPGNTDGVVGLLIMGILFIVLPTGLVFAVGGRELVPPFVRVGWNMHFGKLRNADADSDFKAAEPFARETEPLVPEESPSYPPPVKNFREEIVSWYPGRRVELVKSPPNVGFLILGSGIFGVFVSLFGGVLSGLLLFGANAPTAHYGVIAAALFTITFIGVFATSRWQDRGSRTVFDWDTNMLDAHREFSFSWQGSLHDIHGLTARLTRDKGRYRAEIEVEAVGNRLLIARTLQPRRKPDAIREEASSLAIPLATALGVPLQMQGWDNAD